MLDIVPLEELQPAVKVMSGVAGFTVNALVPKRGYHLSFLPGVCQHVFVLCCRLRVSREAHRMQLEPFGEGPRPRGVRPSVSSWRAAAEHSPLSDTRARGSLAI